MAFSWPLVADGSSCSSIHRTRNSTQMHASIYCPLVIILRRNTLLGDVTRNRKVWIDRLQHVQLKIHIWKFQRYSLKTVSTASLMLLRGAHGLLIYICIAVYMYVIILCSCVILAKKQQKKKPTAARSGPSSATIDISSSDEEPTRAIPAKRQKKKRTPASIGPSSATIDISSSDEEPQTQSGVTIQKVRLNAAEVDAIQNVFKVCTLLWHIPC